MKRSILFLILALLAGNAIAWADEGRARMGRGDSLSDSSDKGDGGRDKGSFRQPREESPKASQPESSKEERVNQPREQKGIDRVIRGTVNRPKLNGTKGSSPRISPQKGDGPAREPKQGVFDAQPVKADKRQNFKHEKLQNDRPASDLKENRDGRNETLRIENRTQPGRAAATVPSQFKKYGIRSYPHPITERSHFVTSDRNHSVVQFPSTGPKGENLRAKVFGRTSLSAPVVRNHMASVVNPRFTSQVASLNITENRVNHYYWHTYNGSNYCHYYDPWGYHWYGWYIGSNYFWTRYYYDRWWWYDPTYYRWCYWHDGGWWWQDPYHVNTVYVYVNGSYVASSAGGDVNVTVTNPSANSARVYRSSDGSRMVKVTGSAEDAFLYDTSEDPTFQPIYLASGVKEVKLSNTSNGRPLQIMLTLNDGSFDLFDDQGNSFTGSNQGGN
jgi:hypothetical protein